MGYRSGFASTSEVFGKNALGGSRVSSRAICAAAVVAIAGVACGVRDGDPSDIEQIWTVEEQKLLEEHLDSDGNLDLDAYKEALSNKELEGYPLHRGVALGEIDPSDVDEEIFLAESIKMLEDHVEDALRERNGEVPGFAVDATYETDERYRLHIETDQYSEEMLYGDTSPGTFVGVKMPTGFPSEGIYPGVSLRDSRIWKDGSQWRVQGVTKDRPRKASTVLRDRLAAHGWLHKERNLSGAAGDVELREMSFTKGAKVVTLTVSREQGPYFSAFTVVDIHVTKVASRESE